MNEREEVIGEIVDLRIKEYKQQLINETKNYGIRKNDDGTTTHSVTLSFEGSVNHAIRSGGKEAWGIKEACRMYNEGREAWLKGDFETVASLFGVLK
jgi:hypothetical protein